MKKTVDTTPSREEYQRMLEVIVQFSTKYEDRVWAARVLAKMQEEASE